MEHHLRRKTLALAAAVTLAWGCDRGSHAQHVVARDSAGVSIVETGRMRWDDTNAWRIDPEPALQIGVVEGDSAYQFYLVFSAVRLDDGRIVTADMTTNRLRFFASDGELLSSLGGRGSGPGEFEGLYQVIRLPGDSLLAWDGQRRRVTLLDVHGAVASTFMLGQPGPEPLAGLGRLSDGRIVTATGWSSAQLKSRVESGLMRSPSPVLVFGPAGGVGDTYAVSEYTPSGTLIGVFRGPPADLTLDAGAVEDFRQANPDLVPEGEPREREERHLASMPLPETRAAFVSPDGEFLGKVVAPAGLRIYDVGADYVLGRWQDEAQVEFIRLHRLVRR